MRQHEGPGDEARESQSVPEEGEAQTPAGEAGRCWSCRNWWKIAIAVVLGVTAYALEEEYETITPLLARPIPINDIFATKLGIRLGLLFLSMIVIALIEFWTGAWPIE